jgi:hypothetical protein
MQQAPGVENKTQIRNFKKKKSKSRVILRIARKFRQAI